MASKLIEALERTRVVPLVQSDDPATALKISEALLEGGLDVLEVVLRTDAALDCLEAIAKEFPTLMSALAQSLVRNNPKRLSHAGQGLSYRLVWMRRR